MENLSEAMQPSMQFIHFVVKQKPATINFTHVQATSFKHHHDYDGVRGDPCFWLRLKANAFAMASRM